MIYDFISKKSKQNKKLFALLIDPDKTNPAKLIRTLELANKAGVDLLLIGGSLIMSGFHETISIIKQNSSIPAILFPGSTYQIDPNADALFLLSLISGRNADLLIGNHVIAAPFIRKSNLEVISVGYILINGGTDTSVSYMSNTMPIPHNKTEIAVATAMAGEMTGKKLIYLEAGSGAAKPVGFEMIKAVKASIQIPLIVGGGIRTTDQLQTICEAGADIIVVGTAIEENPGLLISMTEKIHSF